MKFKKMKFVYYGHDLADAVTEMYSRGWVLVKWKWCWRKGDVSKVTFIKKVK